MFTSVLKEKGHILLQETFLQRPHTLSIFFLYFIWYCNSRLKNLWRNQCTRTRSGTSTKHAVQKQRCGKQNRCATSTKQSRSEAGSQKHGMAHHSTRGTWHSQQVRPCLSSSLLIRHRCCKLSGRSFYQQEDKELVALSRDTACPLPQDMHLLLLSALTLQNTSGHTGHGQLCSSGTSAGA